MLASLLLCAWAPKAPPLRIHSIGIIAAVGDTCAFERVPDRPFEWIGPPEARFLEISDWGIDDDLTKSVAAALKPVYATQAISIEHQDFDTWTYDSLTHHIRELPMPEVPIDAYLLILRDWRADDIGGSDHSLVGLGVYRRDRPEGRARYGVFAAFRLILLEPERGRMIASRAAVLPNGQAPWLPVSASLWPRTENDLTDAQRDAFRGDFLRLLDAALPNSLAKIGLVTKTVMARRGAAEQR
ncbi:MAG TPA: hypothetical protein VHT03_00975 [Rhizomicrobium sp.]|jgi:hypothetical protein|nr:hypothetical protein [Rhizomicrobium sp.]